MDPKKREYIDKTAAKILNSIKERVDESVNAKTKLKGNLGEKSVIDLQDSIISYRETIQEIDGQPVAIYQYYNDKTGYSIEGDAYQQLESLIKQVNKDPYIKDTVTLNSLREIIIDWMFKAFKNREKVGLLSKFIQQTIARSSKRYKIFIPVPHLNISYNIKFGNVSFEYFNSKKLDDFIEELSQRSPKKRDDFLKLKNVFKGKVYAIITYKGHQQRVKELAIEECALSIDCLRICSTVMTSPNVKSDFDIEKNLNVSLASNIICLPIDKVEDIQIEKEKNSEDYTINSSEFLDMQRRDLRKYHKFILESKRSSELEKLILNGIRSFSEALKENNYSKRVSKIFSVYESLLLISNDVPIMQSLCKYGTKLIFNEINERKEIEGVFKKLYTVRSRYVHHLKVTAYPSKGL